MVKGEKISKNAVMEMLRDHINLPDDERRGEKTILITYKERKDDEGKVEEIIVMANGLTRFEAIGMLEIAKIRLSSDDPQNIGLKQMRKDNPMFS